MTLGQARQALKREDREEALERLLEAWRLNRAPEIAQLFESLARGSARDASPPAAKTPKARHEAWLEVAKHGNATARQPLFDAIVVPRSNKKSLERLLALVERGPDPRLTTWALAIAADPPFNASVDRTKTFYRAVFEVFVTQRDSRALRSLRSLGERFADEARPAEREAQLKRAKKVSETLGRLVAPELSAEELTDCHEIHAWIEHAEEGANKRVDASTSPAALLAAVFADPSDLTRRYVLADLLLERGDPFAEFLRLQLDASERALTPNERVRMSALQKLHEDEFLHGLAPHVLKGERVFERGFLVRAKADTWVDHPALSTVRTMIRAVPRDEHDPRSLEELLLTPQTSLGELLGKRRTPLPEVHTFTMVGPHWDYIDGDYDWWAGIREITARLHGISALTNVRVLGLVGTRVWSGANGPRPADFDWVWGAPCARALTTFMVTTHPRHLPAWLALQEKRQLPSLVLSTRGSNDPETPCEVQVNRGDALDIAIATGRARKGKRNPRQDLGAILDSLANVAGIRSLTIDAAAEEACAGGVATRLRDSSFGEVRFAAVEPLLFHKARMSMSSLLL